MIRNLDKKGVHFVWEAEHQACFESIKSLVSQSMTLAYYDRTKPVVLQTDYSEDGLGAVLVQEGRPIRFGSKAVSDSEMDYAPIKGEMLGIVHGINKFHHYLYGRRFTVECDHT